MTPTAKPNYRIKGLSDVAGHPPTCGASDLTASRDRVAKSFGTNLGGNSVEVLLAAAVRALGPLTLGDYVQGIPELGLRQAWPTCSFFEVSKDKFPIKRLPLALGELMMGPEKGFEHLYSAWERLDKTKLKLRQLLELSHSGKVPAFPVDQLPPIASAIGAYLFRGSTWFNRNRAGLLTSICTSPEAGYIALLSGVWACEASKLAQVVAANPRLALDVKSNSSLYSASIHLSLKDILKSAPHLWCHSPNRNIHGGNESAWKNLVDAADNDLMAAAMVYGLAPDADHLLDRIKASPEAMYWTVRFGSQIREADKLPFWRLFRPLVLQNLKWGYHWICHFEPGRGYEYFHLHWPDPWMIEVAQDLGLHGDAIQTAHRISKENGTLDRHPLCQVITWWAGNYVCRTEKDDRE